VVQEYLDLWKEFEIKERPAFQKKAKNLDSRQGMRIVPVNVSIEPQNQILAFEDVNKMIQEAEKIAVTNCSCRTIHSITDVPLEVCMQLNKAAAYALERGTGRELTKDEAIEMLRMCEKEGLVHCVVNAHDLGSVICNCDKVACGNWGYDRAYVKKFVAPSRFKAKVDPELCTACETCADRCFFDAVSMEGRNDKAFIVADKCMGCGICVPTCPGDAIIYEEVRPEEFIPRQ
jgi:Pyruvate/2-oxoacid:ferredoxin oxidoreductase delta subunit